MNTGDITVQELNERLSNNETLNMVDVREFFEHDVSNIGGVHIPLGDLPNQVGDLDAYKDQELIVYCRSGNRSGRACDFLRSQGFSNVRNLTGGITRWAQEIDPGLPVA